MHREREETRLGKQLTEKISLPENNINVSNVILSEDRKTKLQAIRNRRQEGMQVRLRKSGYKVAKKQVNVVCSLENRNFTSKSICFIKHNNGEKKKFQEEIMKETRTL